MLRLTAPSEHELRRFLSQQERSGFSYSEVGSSATHIPPGYNLDHSRVQLGAGEEAWKRAVDALRRWEMFSLVWVRIFPRAAPIQPGKTLSFALATSESIP